MRQIKLKREFRFNNSKQNLVYLSFVTLLGLSIYTIKAQKTKNRVLLYKQQQQKPTRIFII
jgi:hypothetical protein